MNLLRKLATLTLLTTFMAAAAAPVHAQDKPEALPQGGASPGSADSIPTDKPKLRAFCADRPGQATLPCTVDPGHFQLEADAFNFTYDRQPSGAEATSLYTNPNLKLGIAPRTDIEAQISPYEQVRMSASGGAPPSTVSGVGDLTVRLKQNVYGDYRGPLAVAIEPFVKAPTARRGIGDGAWEGGVLAPFALGLSKSLVLNFTPEIDVIKNQLGGGVHPEVFGAANVTLSLPLNLGFLVEFTGRRVQDPSGAYSQYTSDFALSLGLENDLELDVGINHGLNARAPANAVYAGVGKRF